MATKKFTEEDFLYPETDDLPEAESDLHRRLVTDLIARLEARYAAEPNVYVSGMLRVYCEEWNPYDVAVPDCFVVFGVPKRDRNEYRGWQEGRLPAVVIEVTSSYTQQEDRYSKPSKYREDWRVDEYFVIDPREEYLVPSLQGYRRNRNKYDPIPLGDEGLTSKVLGVTLHRDGLRLVLHEAATGAELLTAAEAKAARLEAELAALSKKKPSA